MVARKRSVTVYQCERCQHEWIPRDALEAEQELPTVCPTCKSPYWNRPRANEGGPKKRKRRRAT